MSKNTIKSVHARRVWDSRGRPTVEVDMTDDIKEGGQNEYIHRLPGRLKWSNLVLKRGTTDSNLFDWFKASSGEGFEENRGRLERTTAALASLPWP